MINFKEITNANIWKVCTLEPFEEQKDFVAENKKEDTAEAVKETESTENAEEKQKIGMIPACFHSPQEPCRLLTSAGCRITI